MATHPDHSRAHRIRPSIMVALGAMPAPAAPPALDDPHEFESEQARQVEAATGYTPDHFRRFEAITSRLLVASALLLLGFMALRIVAAAFGGRL